MILLGVIVGATVAMLFIVDHFTLFQVNLRKI